MSIRIHIAPRICLPSVILTALFIVAAFGTPAFGQQVSTIRSFDAGTRLLNSGDFRGAIEAYQSAEDAGQGSAALFHNRAIAHYRLDEIGRSIQYLEKAAMLSKKDPIIRHSLEIVSTRLIDSYSELPVPIWTRFQRTVLGLLPVTSLMYMGILFYLALCFILFMNILGYWRGSWYRRIRTVTATLSIVLLLMAFSSSLWPAYPQEAAIIVDETNVFEQPDLDAPVNEQIHEGLVVQLVAEDANWSLVQLPNGARGWVSTQTLGSI